MPLASRPATRPRMRSTAAAAARRAAWLSCAPRSRTKARPASRLVSASVRRSCDCARSTCRSAARTRARRWPNTGTGSSTVACCCELASNTVRSPPLGVERPIDSVGLASAPAAERSARAMSASRADTATRGLDCTMRITSPSDTAGGSCAQEGAPASASAAAALSRLIFALGRAVALGSEHVIDAGQDEQRDDERRHHAADDDQRERPLRLAADTLRKRHRQEAKEREQRRHQYRTQLLDRTRDDRGLERRTGGAMVLDRARLQETEQRHLAEKGDEAHHRAHRQRHAAKLERKDAAR